jgi:membrane-anchored glycerophosphoryl diester phosphodiesterase (GDPDase)
MLSFIHFFILKRHEKEVVHLSRSRPSSISAAAVFYISSRALLLYPVMVLKELKAKKKFNKSHGIKDE